MRSYRWSASGVRALTENGIVTARFDEIAQVDFPDVDRLTAAVGDGRGTDGFVVRMETTSGAVITFQRESSTSIAADERILAYLSHRGISLGEALEHGYTLTRRRRGFFLWSRRSSTERHLHVLRPAWTHERIVVPDAAVLCRSYRQASEIPLSQLPAKTLAEKGLLVTRPRWRRNQNLRDGTMVCGAMRADLGIATRSYSQIAFQIPAGAKEFSSWVGIDRSVGRGGCVRCKVFLGDTFGEPVSGEPVWTSPFLRGGEQPARIETIDVSQAKQVVLVTEYGHADRPEAADPLDIRDEVNWLLPSVRIDPAVFYAGN